MLCITSRSDDPCFNLALEEVLLKNSDEEYLIFSINRPSVIIGKHQTAHREVDSGFAYLNDIGVIRRISGGGTVYHDHGNLNWAFIRNSEEGKQVDFSKYTAPVIDFLVSLGIDARLEGVSDIRAGGFKISGNAEHVHRNRVLHHGTLLWDTTLDMLRNSIRKDTSCYSTRSVRSNPTRVKNLAEMVSGFDGIGELRSAMLHHMLQTFPGSETRYISEAEETAANFLAESKYRTWEWNYAYGPEYTFSNTFTLNGRPHTCTMHVEGGIIQSFSISGSSGMEAAVSLFLGKRHMINDIADVLNEEGIFLGENEIFAFF